MTDQQTTPTQHELKELQRELTAFTEKVLNQKAYEETHLDNPELVQYAKACISELDVCIAHLDAANDLLRRYNF